MARISGSHIARLTLVLAATLGLSLTAPFRTLAADLTNVDGLEGARRLAVSPDGANAYVAASEEDALTAFTRGPANGELTPLEIHHNGLGGVTAMDEPRAVVVSPDGAHVYVASSLSDAVVLFDRDASTGALTFVGAWSDASLDRAESMTLSPDGSNLYVGGWSFVTVFVRDGSTGELTLLESELITNRVGDLAVSPDGAHLYATDAFQGGGVRVFTRDPLSGALTHWQLNNWPQEPDAIAISPDGAHVYAGGSSTSSRDDFTIFSRNPVSGTITRVDTLPNWAGTNSIVISPDGLFVYVGARGLVFSRDPVTGLLTQLQEVGWSSGLALSPDAAYLYGVSGGIVVYARDAISGLLTQVQRVQGPARREEGKRLRLTNKVPDDPERNRVSMKATISRGSTPFPGCDGDPPGTVKASIRFYSDSSGQDTGPIPLPCENWIVNVPTAATKWRYRDRELDQGPCKVVQLIGLKFKAVCLGRGATTEFPYDLVEGTGEGNIWAVVRLSGTKFCMVFSPINGRDGSDGKRFASNESPRPEICPPPNAFP